MVGRRLRFDIVLPIVLTTLLLTLGACEPSTGTLKVTTRTEGDTLDQDGYAVVTARIDTVADSLGVRDTQTVEINGTIRFGRRKTGTYHVALTGVQTNCAPEGPTPRRVLVHPEDTTTTSFSITCEPALLNRIVFSSRRSEDPDPYDDNSEIFAIQPDGSGLTRLTHNVEGHTVDEDRAPVVSPTGRWIAFVSQRDNNREIYRMGPDGSAVTRLTYNDWGRSNRAWDVHPTFSPAGTTLAYESHRPDRHDGGVIGTQADIYEMNVRDKTPRPITQGDAFEQSPEYSPDGTTIVYQVYPGGANSTRDLYATNPDGGDSTRLTNNDAFDGGHDFSSDGKRIVFVSDRDGNLDLYVMNADGSGVTRLTEHEAADSSPTYCPPDGPIVFTSKRDGNDEIYAVNPDGSDLSRLTNHEAQDTGPTCSPTGHRVAFVSKRDGNNEIYLVGTDGSNLRRLTSDPAIDQSPDWAPAR